MQRVSCLFKTQEERDYDLWLAMIVLLCWLMREESQTLLFLLLNKFCNQYIKFFTRSPLIMVRFYSYLLPSPQSYNRRNFKINYWKSYTLDFRNILFTRWSVTTYIIYNLTVYRFDWCISPSDGVKLDKITLKYSTECVLSRIADIHRIITQNNMPVQANIFQHHIAAFNGKNRQNSSLSAYCFLSIIAPTTRGKICKMLFIFFEVSH